LNFDICDAWAWSFEIGRNRCVSANSVPFDFPKHTAVNSKGLTGVTVGVSVVCIRRHTYAKCIDMLQLPSVFM
jgi:hypothetical protein